MVERHLANLEYGVGNASILILLNVTRALQCSLAEVLGDVTTRSPEWLMLREMLSDRDDATLRRVRVAGGFRTPRRDAAAQRRSARPIATDRTHRLARRGQIDARADAGGRPRISVRRAQPRNREARRLQHQREILGLYGQNAYRRYERRALEEAIDAHPEAVIATAGGLVSDLGSFNLLLRRCMSVWLKADPEDHMGRVAAQGDLRPMAASREAMEDLKSILAGRAAFYSKADIHIDTSAQPLVETFEILRAQARDAIGVPGL